MSQRHYASIAGDTEQRLGGGNEVIVGKAIANRIVSAVGVAGGGGDADCCACGGVLSYLVERAISVWLCGEDYIVFVDICYCDSEGAVGAGAIAGGGFDFYVVAGGGFVIEAVAVGQGYYAGIARDAEQVVGAGLAIVVEAVADRIVSAISIAGGSGDADCCACGGVLSYLVGSAISVWLCVEADIEFINIGYVDGEGVGGAGAIAGAGFDCYVVAGGGFVIEAVAVSQGYYAGVAGYAE